MDTQNTPVHFNLWHRDFWCLCFANLFLMTSIYMLLLSIPYFMTKEGYSVTQIGVVYAAYGLGIFLLGGFCSYLVQRYRRNGVCQISILGVAVSLVVLYYLETFWNIKVGFEMLVAMRLIQGAFLGLAEMSLASTLIIDTCESFQRTEANYITSWFARFSIAVGPLLSLLVYNVFSMKVVFPVASVLALVALVLVSRVKFPFKAPSENVSLISSDRFFLPQGFPLFINIVCIMVIPGFYLSLPHSLTVYAMFFCGLFLALVAEKYVFADAELKSQVIVGLILIAAAEFVSLSDQDFAEEMLVPALLALGVGIIGSRFLLFYIKLAKHCQRGTSMSSFFLAWELGLSFKGRFVSCNLGIVRTTHVFVLIRLVEGFLIKFLSFFLGLLHGFFLGIALGVVFGRFHGKLLCLDFFLSHAYFALETETIAMREEDVLVIISVPVLFEHGRNFALCETLLEEVWMLDIVIVGDTSILRYLLVERGEEEVCLILVT